jgi:enamine deaminase RidA (YjgF/YER057c/UK114 family)
MFVSTGDGSYDGNLKMRKMSATTATGGNEIASTGPLPRRMVTPQRDTPGDPTDLSLVDLGSCMRVALMVTPRNRGLFQEQAKEVLERMREAIQAQGTPLSLTSQTVFLRDPEDEVHFQRLIESHFGEQKPLTTFVYQPPCDGAALAVEAWAIGGPSVQVESFGPRAVAVSYDDMRWVFCGGICVGSHLEGVYAQAGVAFRKMSETLARAGSNLEHTVRTWFYLGGITDPERDTQRYKELNRARTDFYHGLRFQSRLAEPNVPQGIYPASTGIGMQGLGLSAGCLTLQTQRKDVQLLALENPQQTPAYAYHPRYSPQSPKFSRAMALVLGNYVTAWVSGTASIVDSESLHAGDPVRQTEQTIENIERLISEENFAFHGIKGAGARLKDLAKIRVYVKRTEDFATVQSICVERFGSVPAVYAVADVCRPELLVEIEGVAFSRRF